MTLVPNFPRIMNESGLEIATVFEFSGYKALPAVDVSARFSLLSAAADMLAALKAQEAAHQLAPTAASATECRRKWDAMQARAHELRISAIDKAEGRA